jgi:hypothetical protein
MHKQQLSWLRAGYSCMAGLTAGFACVGRHLAATLFRKQCAHEGCEIPSVSRGARLVVVMATHKPSLGLLSLLRIARTSFHGFLMSMHVAVLYVGHVFHKAVSWSQTTQNPPF